METTSLDFIKKEDAWKLEASCRGLDPAMFFPAPADMKGLEAALAICADCPVKEECLKANLWEKDGVWGGTSAKKRAKIRIADEGKTRSCMWCDKQFPPKNPSERMCSDECRTAARRHAKIKCGSSK